jgi:predicted pyridoxine 5'-phosphate oxidase superfamily flavin-nucleotide-binding protein
VYDDEYLFFGDIRSPQTIRNLSANPAIEVNVVDVFARPGYRFNGTGTIHRRGDVYDRCVEPLRERDYDVRRVRAIVLIRVTNAEPLTSPAYDVGASEAELVEHYSAYYLQASHARGRCDV